MPRVKIHHSQLTLPDELRRALSVADEQERDAELVEEGILVKPSPEARRRAGLADIRAVQAGVRLSPELAAMSPEEAEQAISQMLAADKADEAAKRGRD